MAAVALFVKADISELTYSAGSALALTLKRRERAVRARRTNILSFAFLSSAGCARVTRHLTFGGCETTWGALHASELAVRRAEPTLGAVRALGQPCLGGDFAGLAHLALRLARGLDSAANRAFGAYGGTLLGREETRVARRAGPKFFGSPRDIHTHSQTHIHTHSQTLTHPLTNTYALANTHSYSQNTHS